MGVDKSIAMVTELRVDAWLNAAQPGAELIYARGFSPKAMGEYLNDRLRRLQGGGYLYLKQRRNPEGVGFFYVAERSSRPMTAKPLDPPRRGPVGAGRV